MLRMQLSVKTLTSIFSTQKTKEKPKRQCTLCFLKSPRINSAIYGPLNLNVMQEINHFLFFILVNKAAESQVPNSVKAAILRMVVRTKDKDIILPFSTLISSVTSQLSSKGITSAWALVGWYCPTSVHRYHPTPLGLLLPLM